MLISWAITTHNERDYIQTLLNQLIPFCNETGDEIVVVDDYSTDEFTCSLLNAYASSGDIKLVQHALNNNFAEHKNFLTEQCSGDYIFQIDADETLHSNLLTYIHDLIEHNPQIDLFAIPRVNVVTGLTEEDIAKWGWRVSKLDSHIGEKLIDTESAEYKMLKNNGLIIDETGAIVKIKYYIPIVQAPDYQTRVYRNHPDIKWEGKVHERITGYKTSATFPDEEEWALYHIKDISRQRAQNDFYNTMV